jgi:hypothetical protein
MSKKPRKPASFAKNAIALRVKRGAIFYFYSEKNAPDRWAARYRLIRQSDEFSSFSTRGASGIALERSPRTFSRAQIRLSGQPRNGAVGEP